MFAITASGESRVISSTILASAAARNPNTFSANLAETVASACPG